MKKIIHSLLVKTPAAKVYAALATERGLAGWWSTKVTAVERIGGIVDFEFIGDFNPDMEITKLEKNKSVHWKCVGGHDNWLDNTFAFDMNEAEGGTQIMFVQIYAQELSDEVYGTYNFNWGYYLNSLKQFCETGAGTPFQA